MGFISLPMVMGSQKTGRHQNFGIDVDLNVAHTGPQATI